MSKKLEIESYVKLEHKGVFLGFPYEPLPEGSRIRYSNGTLVDQKNNDNPFNMCEEEALRLFVSFIISKIPHFNKTAGKGIKPSVGAEVLESGNSILQSIGKKKSYSKINASDFKTLLLDKKTVAEAKKSGKGISYLITNFLNDFNTIRLYNKAKDITHEELASIDFQPYFKFWEKNTIYRMTSEYKKKYSMKVAIVRAYFSNMVVRRETDAEDIIIYNKSFSAEAPSISGIKDYEGYIKKRLSSNDFELNLIPKPKYGEEPPVMIWENGDLVETDEKWIIKSGGNPKYLASFRKHACYGVYEKGRGKNKIETNWKLDKQGQLNIEKGVSLHVKQNDKNKFESARFLNYHIEQVRDKYNNTFEKGTDNEKLLSLAVYLLDKLAIRPGGNKVKKNFNPDDENDVQGLLDLNCENIEFLPNFVVKFTFLGKSGVPFIEETKMEKKYYNFLKGICPTRKSNDIFSLKDKLKSLNTFIGTLKVANDDDIAVTYLHDWHVTAKTFRTRLACYTFQKYLHENEIKIDAKQSEKKQIFVKANLEVAKALNHKSLAGDVTKAFAKSILAVIKKKDEFKTEIEVLEKYSKDDEKRALTMEDHEKRTNQVLIIYNKVKDNLGDENQAGLTRLEMKKENISLGTSIANYVDPRIVVAWCKKVDFPIEKCYQTASLKKFKWAMATLSTWSFFDEI